MGEKVSGQIRKRPAANESAQACMPKMNLAATMKESRRKRMCSCIQYMHACVGHKLENHFS